MLLPPVLPPPETPYVYMSPSDSPPLLSHSPLKSTMNSSISEIISESLFKSSRLSSSVEFCISAIAPSSELP